MWRPAAHCTRAHPPAILNQFAPNEGLTTSDKLLTSLETKLFANLSNQKDARVRAAREIRTPRSHTYVCSVPLSELMQAMPVSNFLSHLATKICFIFGRPSGAFCLWQNARARAARGSAGQATSGNEFFEICLKGVALTRAHRARRARPGSG